MCSLPHHVLELADAVRLCEEVNDQRFFSSSASSSFQVTLLTTSDLLQPCGETDMDIPKGNGERGDGK